MNKHETAKIAARAYYNLVVGIIPMTRALCEEAIKEGGVDKISRESKYAIVRHVELCAEMGAVAIEGLGLAVDDIGLAKSMLDNAKKHEVESSLPVSDEIAKQAHEFINRISKGANEAN